MFYNRLNGKSKTICTIYWPAHLACLIGLLGITACRSEDELNTRAYEVFMRYFFQGVPESVTNIRLDQPGRFYGRTYALRFGINKNDFTRLKEARPFVKVWDLIYEDGSLDWHWDRGDDNDLGIRIPKYGSSLSLYGSVWKPIWFKPEKLKNPEVYAFYQKGDIQNTEVFESDETAQGHTTLIVLIYNEKEGEAYLVANDYSH